jgi:hypothetical protein
MARFRPALINAGYAACFEFAIAIAAAQTIGGVRAQALAGIAVGSALVAGGAEAQLVTRAVTQRDAALIGAVMTAGPVMSAAAMAAAEIGEVAAAAVGISVTVGVGAVEINRILRHIKVDPIARQNIGLAMQIGSLAGLAIASRGPLAKLPVTTLVAAVAAGVLTLVRR